MKGAEPTAWERKSDKNLQDSHKARAKSERLRAEVGVEERIVLR